MDMIIFKEGDMLDVVTTRQAVEAVQLAVTIWSGNHDSIAIGELARAILQDEPLKMRRLADIFHVDIASLNSMWLLSGETSEDSEKLAAIADVIQRYTETYSATVIKEIYDGILVLFMVGPGSIYDIRSLTDSIGHELEARNISATLIRGHALNTTSRVREAFLNYRSAFDAAKKIYPGRWVYTIEQIDFAQQCQEIVNNGERAVEAAFKCLRNLSSNQDGANLMETLECYLLDSDMSVTQTAEKMFLHKNTIKYRIQRIADELGFVPGDFPETIPVISACALKRLMRQE